MLAADEVVAVSKDTISLCESGRTTGVINSHIIPTADFILNRDFNFQNRKVSSVLETALRKETSFFDFTRPAEVLLGDSIATNIMMMGQRRQKARCRCRRGGDRTGDRGQRRLDQDEHAGVPAWTARFAAEPARLDAMMQGQDEAHAPKALDSMSLEEIIAHRSEFLTGYQSRRLAKRYRALVDQVHDAATKGSHGDALPRAVAINYAKLLAYKDEYEVARLFADGKFERQLRDQFEGDFKFSFNLAPPILGGGKDALGRPKKRAFGAWMLAVFRRAGQRKRLLRGTALDICTQPRPQADDRDRGLREGRRDRAGTSLSPSSTPWSCCRCPIASALALVKEKAVNDAKARYDQLAADLVNPPSAPRQIAAE